MRDENQQVQWPADRNLLELCHQSTVPTMPLSKMLPPRMHSQFWVHEILARTGQLLGVQQ